MEPAGTGGEASDRETAGFFVPDLCGSRAVLILVLLAELAAVVHVLANSVLPAFDWHRLAITSLLIQWTVLLSAALLCRLRPALSRRSLPVASLAMLLVVLAVTLASSYLAQRLFPQVAAEQLNGWWLLRNMLVAVVFAGIALRYFYLQQQLQRQQRLELEARIEALRSRIRPHFLFNTLNSIASLIGSHPAAAERAVEDLADLFRASLHDADHDTTVADELHLCELYLGIEQLRLGDRLQVRWQVDDAARGEQMPGLMLQPLVENAVYHGISLLPGGGTVQIRVQLSAGNVQASVENPLPTQVPRSGGHQLALSNIRERLSALYGSAGKLDVQRGDDTFRVQLSYPRELPA